MPIMEATLEGEFKRNKDLKKDDLDKLREWAESQPHLPKISDVQLAIFFHSCYYSNEATKICIDNYYTCKLLCPEFFANRDPTNNELTVSYKNACIVILKKPTHEGYRVLYGKLTTFKPELFNLHTQLKVVDMSLSLVHRQEGSKPGFIVVLDTHGLQLGHLLRLNPLVIKKFLYYLQEAMPVRLQGFHFVNCVPFMDKVLALMKPFMKKELMDMLALHQPKSQAIFKYIPQECFLNEFGGQGGPENEVHDEHLKNMKDNKEFFVNEEVLVADESKRQGRAKNAGDLFGVEGTFKKLDID